MKRVTSIGGIFFQVKGAPALQAWCPRDLGGGETARPPVDAETRRRHTMNILLWILQVFAALLYAASGVMKVFMFDKVSADVPSAGGLA